MEIFGNEFVVYRKKVKGEIWKRTLQLYWNRKYLRETAFCNAGLEKQTIFSDFSKTPDQFITMEDRIPFQGKFLWDLWWTNRHCNIFNKVLSFSQSVSFYQLFTFTFTHITQTLYLTYIN